MIQKQFCIVFVRTRYREKVSNIPSIKFIGQKMGRKAYTETTYLWWIIDLLAFLEYRTLLLILPIYAAK